jgi:peptidoglycan/LPS O-acetylase OafA/YrhL
MTPKIQTGQHFGELDSLRGLAALVVVFHHFVLLGDPMSYAKLVSHVMINGHSAVVLFFVLSGFVLALPIARGTAQPYTAYLVRRVCRIYLPYLAALSLALTCDYLFHKRQILSPFVASAWSVPVSFRLVAQHMGFVGVYDYTQVNPAFWSLVHEMRISLVFPPFCIALYRLRLAPAFLLLAALTCLGTVLSMQMPSQARTFVTIHYLAVFGLGALLARNLSQIASWYTTLGRLTKVAAAFLGAVLYVSRTEGMALRIGSLADVPVALGATLLVILVLNSVTLKALLALGLPRFLGRISYSLYLIHVTVLFVLLHFFAGNRPLLLAIYLAGAIACAHILWKFVEQPSIQLGKSLSSKINRSADGATRIPVDLSAAADHNLKTCEAESRRELLTT